MRNKKLLLLLADKLDSLPANAEYNMMNHAHDALFWASSLREFKEAGFLYAANDSKEPGLHKVWFKKHSDVEAAAKFFDIEILHAQHLFGAHEMDPFGYMSKSLFAVDGAREGGYGRDKEPPAFTAARIKAFVREYPDFNGYKTKVEASNGATQQAS